MSFSMCVLVVSSMGVLVKSSYGRPGDFFHWCPSEVFQGCPGVKSLMSVPVNPGSGESWLSVDG